MAELFTTVGTLHLLIAEASDIFSPHFIPKQLSKLSPKKMLNFNATTTKNVRLVVPTSSPDRPNPNNDPSTTVCAAFAAVCISSDNGDEIYKYDTFVQPCYDLSTDGVVGLGEEFVFESISSTSIISISVYAILSFANNNVIKDKDLDSSIQSRSSYTLFPSRYKASSPENRFESKIERRVVCVGMISIPVSRLEENKKNSQWYQLSDSSTNNGLRSSIKVECLFVNEDGPVQQISEESKQNSSLIANLENEYSFQHPDQLFSVKQSLSSTTMNGSSTKTGTDSGKFATATAIDNTLDFQKFSGIDSMTHILFNSSNFIKNNENLNLASIQAPAHKGATKNVQNARVLIRPKVGEVTPLSDSKRGRSDNVRSSNTVEDEDASNFPLESGLVDYCLILGPPSIEHLEPTHTILDSGKMLSRTIGCSSPSKLSNQDRSPNSPTSSGLFGTSSSSNWWMPSEEVNSVTWDRLPRQDHDDVEMPSHIEWFACPEGVKTVLHHKRPDPYFNSFILCTGDGEEQFGLSLNYFIDVGRYDEKGCNASYSSMHNRRAEEMASENSSKWWSGGGDEIGFYDSMSSDISDPEKKSIRLWTAVTVCTLFRHSFLQQISDCFELAYISAILPSIIDWEEKRRSASNGVNRDINSAQYHLNIEYLVAKLMLECPKPIAGLLSISLRLPSLNLPRLEVPEWNIYRSNKTTPDNNEMIVNFQQTIVNDLPRCAYPFQYLLKYFEPRVLVDIVCAVLSESRLLFHSTELSKLPLICEGLRTLIYPLKWTHVYLPVVPLHLLSLIEAPVPFMLGTHTEWLRYIHPEKLEDIMLVDCESGAIESRGSQVLQLPPKEDRWLLLGLKTIAHDYCTQSVQNSFVSGIDDNREEIQEARKTNGSAARDLSPDLGMGPIVTSLRACTLDLQIQLLFFDVMFNLLRYVPDCLFYLNSSCPVFNRALFISEYATDDIKAVLEQLTVTNSFHELTENIHTPSVKFFLDCIDRVNNSEMRKFDMDLNNEKGCSESKCNIPGYDKTGDVGVSNGKTPMTLPIRTLPTSRSNGILATPRNGMLSTSRNNAGMKLKRPISMANIIYDKIVVNTPRLSKTPKPYRGSSKVPDDPNSRRALVVDFQCEMNSDKTSYVTPEKAPKTSAPDRPHRSALLQQTLTLAEGTHSPKDDVDLYDDSLVNQQQRNIYDHILPDWLFALPTVTVPSKSIKTILLARINVYLPFVKWAQCDFKINAPEVSNLDIQIISYGYRIDHQEAPSNAILPPQEVGPVVNPNRNSHQPECVEVPKSQEHSKLRGFIKIDTEFDVKNADKLRCQLQEDLSSPSSGNDVSPIPVAPLAFNTYRVLLVQELAFRWTLVDLANRLQKNYQSLLRKFKPVHKINHRQSIIGKGYQKNIMQLAATSATLTVTDDFKCDTIVTELLQKIFTEGSLQNEWLEQSIQLSLISLQLEENRKGMVNMLKNAKKRKGIEATHNKRVGDGGMNNFSVYPLNQLAFEAVSALFNGLLQICANQQDYLCAYGLLEVGGLYFRVVESNESALNGDDPSDEFNSIEFLSERTCHHPIYQNPQLWRALMHIRLPLTASRLQDSAAQGSNTAKFNVNEIINETHAQLYVMLGMNVNSARALQFLQAIASDYGLDINEYFKLQRFTGKLWAQNNADFIQTKKREGEIFGSQGISPNNPSRHGSIAKPSSSSQLSLATALSSLQNASSVKELYYSLDELDGRPQSEVKSADATPQVRQGKKNRSPLLHIDAEASTVECPQLSPTPLKDRYKEVPSLRPSWLKLSVDINSANNSVDKNLDSFVGPEQYSSELSPNTLDGSCNVNENMSDERVVVKSPHNCADTSSTLKNLFPMSSISEQTLPVISEEGFTGFKSSGTDYASWIVHNLSRASASPVNTDTYTKIDGPDFLHPSNRYAQIEVKGLEDVHVTVVDTAGHWLVCGSADGNLLVGDLDAMTANVPRAQLQKYKHSSGMSFLDDKYKGITTINCLPTAIENVDGGRKGEASLGQMVFSGCSKGIIKAWLLHEKYSNEQPQSISTNAVHTPMGGSYVGGGNSSSSSWSLAMKMRMKQALTVVKVHSSPITAMLSQSFRYPSLSDGAAGDGGWLLYSGDSSGVVAITRGSEVSTNSVSVGANIIPADNERSGVGGITSFALIGSSSSSAIQSATQQQQFNASSSYWKSSLGGGSGNRRISHYNDILVVGTNSGIVSALDVSTATPVFQVMGHNDKVVQVIGLSSNEFLSCSFDRTIKLWDIRTKTRSSVISIGGSNGLQSWGSKTLGSPSHRKCAYSAITGIAVGGGDNSLVVSSSADGQVRLWDLRFNVNVPCRVLKGHSNRISSLCWDGRSDFHTASHDGTVRSWDSISGHCTNLINVSNHQSGSNKNFPVDVDGITDLAMSQFRSLSSDNSSNTDLRGNSFHSQKQCMLARSWSGSLKAYFCKYL